jgi:hypothetical protein
MDGQILKGVGGDRGNEVNESNNGHIMSQNCL